MPVMSFELFRRIARNAITTPRLLADRPAAPAETLGPIEAAAASAPPAVVADR
jgi:hypothetical protein